MLSTILKAVVRVWEGPPGLEKDRKELGLIGIRVVSDGINESDAFTPHCQHATARGGWFTSNNQEQRFHSFLGGFAQVSPIFP